jgi:hypothetical protein
MTPALKNAKARTALAARIDEILNRMRKAAARRRELTR